MKQQRDQGDVEQEPHGVEGERLEPGDEQHDDPKRKRGGCSRDAEFVAPCLFVGDAERAARQYRVELVAARKALRDVQGNLRRDIDTLAGQVTFVNIVVMPILVGLAALALAWRQRRRRRATQIAGGLRDANPEEGSS